MKRDLSFSSERRSAKERGRGVVVALSAELPKTRTFLAKRVDGVGLLLTRDRNGVVHAFRNECLHRDRPVVDGCGRSRKLTCGKHGWRYDFDGTLLGKRAEPGQQLAALVVTECDGRIWVSFGD